MTVHNLDLPSIAIAPSEADAPLVVDANAVLPGSVATKILRSVAGRDPQVVKAAGSFDCNQPCPNPVLDLHWQPANGMACEDGRGTLAGETPCHGPMQRQTLRRVRSPGDLGNGINSASRTCGAAEECGYGRDCRACRSRREQGGQRSRRHAHSGLRSHACRNNVPLQRPWHHVVACCRDTQPRHRIRDALMHNVSRRHSFGHISRLGIRPGSRDGTAVTSCRLSRSRLAEAARTGRRRRLRQARSVAGPRSNSSRARDRHRAGSD